MTISDFAITDYFNTKNAPFAYSDVSAVMVSSIGAPAFMTMNFDCRITNPSDEILTRMLKLMWKYYDDRYPGVIQYQGELLRFSLTLAPGQTYDYHFEGNYYDPSDGQWYSYLIIALRTTHCLWLEDEYGGKSPEACVQRLT